MGDSLGKGAGGEPVGNMWALFVFGTAVNRRIGNRYYLISYLASVGS